MTRAEARSLVDYHYWARDRMLAAVETLNQADFLHDRGSSFPSVRDTVVHIYAAECVWRGRWAGEPPAPMIDADQFLTVDAIRTAWQEHETRLRAFVETLGEDGIERAITYRTLAGQSQTAVFANMLRHLVNHGTYHRGQVTTMLRQMGAAPPASLDLITYYRESGTL